MLVGTGLVESGRSYPDKGLLGPQGLDTTA